MRWTVECDGWLLLGFAYATGRHPDLAPGSPDLAPLAAFLGDLSRRLTPGPPVEVPRFADRSRGLIAPELVDGDSLLLHTDMTPRNFLLSEGGAGGVRLVGWSGPARGAAWIETALLLHRLIRADHTPAAAEEWAARVPAHARAPEHAVTAFADVLLSLWQRKQRAARHPTTGRFLTPPAAGLPTGSTLHWGSSTAATPSSTTLPINTGWRGINTR